MKMLVPDPVTKRVRWERLTTFWRHRVVRNREDLVDWLDVPESKMHNHFHEATALFSTESAFNADRDLLTGALKQTQHTIAAIDRDQGGMCQERV